MEDQLERSGADGDATVRTLRRFNRAFTQRIGVLDESFLGSGRSLGPARTLFEIGAAGGDGIDVRDLRTRLGLDSGYVSRLLRELESEGSVEVVAHDSDGRRRVARLTGRGVAAWSDLEGRSEAAASGVVAPLSPRQRAELTSALETAERLVRLATIRFEPVDPAGVEARSALAAYFAELDRRFPTGFDPGDELTADMPAYRPPRGMFLVARTDEVVVACGALTQADETTAEVKRMWVHADWRGGGLGRRTLTELERQAAQLGFGRVILDTNSSLTEAIALYERSGYRSIERYNDNPYAFHWYEKSLDAATVSADEGE